MVRLSIIVITLISALSGLAAAKSCKTGGIYCGSSLLKKGNYITNINTGLAAQSIPQSSFNENNSLWDCTAHGEIQFSKLCATGCLDNGKKDDSCQVDEAAKAAAEAAAKRDVGKVWTA